MRYEKIDSDIKLNQKINARGISYFVMFTQRTMKLIWEMSLRSDGANRYQKDEFTRLLHLVIAYKGYV